MASVDVVVPNYNYGHYLEGCVRSVLAQDVERLRVLIIDNASSDHSAEVARTLAKADPRVELRLRTENLGANASFNEGIDWAKAEFFTILCADDLLHPAALKRAAALLVSEPEVHLAYGEAQYIHVPNFEFSPTAPQDTQWRIESGTEFLTRLCLQGKNPVSGPTVLVRTAVQKAIGYYNPDLPHTDDLEMWLRFAMVGRIASTRSVQAMARVHAASQSATVAGINRWNREFEEAFLSFFSGSGATHPQAGGLLKMARRAIGARAFWNGIWQLTQGRPGGGDLLRNAIRLHPAYLLTPPIGYLLDRAHLQNAAALLLSRRRSDVSGQ